MNQDRITQVRIKGLRVIEELTLDLEGLTVLIGDNGTGKSSVVEAFEILRTAAKPVWHIPDVVAKRHGGLTALLRRGAPELSLGVTVKGVGPQIDYDFAIANVGTSPEVVREQVDVFQDPDAAQPLHAIRRDRNGLRVFDVQKRRLVEGRDVNDATIGEQALALPWLGIGSQPAVKRLIGALDSLNVHVAFETRPLWQQKELGISQGPRWPCVVEEVTRLARFGMDLPNAFHALRNRGGEVWQRVLARARLGLGDDLREFKLTPSGRGNIELEVLFGAFPDAPLPAESLSEGQIAYLCFVALCEFHEQSSLLVFDEPELHLHPELLVRVAWMLEEAAKTAPVVLSTHSDQLLDAIAEPGKAVRLCELDERRAMVIRRPNQERLTQWLKDYRGLGSLRSEGYVAHVFDHAEDAMGERP
jgi:predicted ATPase